MPSKNHHISILLILCSWLINTEYARAQDPYPMDYPTMISENYGIEGPLRAIGEDWNGFIWLATNRGVYKFDGTGSRLFTRNDRDTSLTHHSILDLEIDNGRKSIWISSVNGLTRFDPQTQQSVHYFADFDDPRSISDDYVAELHLDRKGRIWIGCYNHGLCQYRPESDDFDTYFFEFPGVDSMQRVNPNINISRLNSIAAISESAVYPDVFWLGTPNGLIKFDLAENAFEWIYLEHKGPNSEFLVENIIELSEINGLLFVGTAARCYIYNPVTGEVNPHFDHDQFPDIPFRIAREFNLYDDSTVLISYPQGMAKYDLRKQEISAFYVDQPPPKGEKDFTNSKFYGIRLIDSKKRVWVYSSGRIVLYDPDKQISQNFPLEDQYPGPLVFEQVNDTTILLLTENAKFYHLFNTRTEKWKTLEMYNPDIEWDQIAWRDWVFQEDGYWYLLDHNRLFKLRLKDHYLIREEIGIPYADPILTKGLLDRDDQLWIGSIRVGLLKYNRSTGKMTSYINELNSPYSSSLYAWILELYEDRKDNIWIRLARSFAVYSPGEDGFTIIPHYEKEEKTFRYICCFRESNGGDMWISSSDSGFGMVDKENVTEGLLKSYTEVDGLLHNEIFQMEFDMNDRLWLLTRDGFSVFDTGNESFRNFAWARGIEETLLFIMMDGNRIAVPLDQGGLQVLRFSELEQKRSLPVPYLTRLNVRDEAFFESGNRIAPQRIKVGQNRDYLSFEFSALGYTNPKEFAYKLSGIDQDWVVTNGLHSTSYSNLHPGEYTFYIKSRIAGSEWSDPAEIPVYLTPCWYETRLFKASVVLLVLLLGFLLYRWRIGEVMRREREKAEIQQKMNELEMQTLRSQMNPHFIFNSLNSIQRYIIKNEKMLASDYLERFARLMRLILQNSRSQLVPLQDELEALRLYMDLEKLRVSEKFEYRIELDPSVHPQNIEIPPMLLQPFVENSIWHGIHGKEGKGNILISFEVRDDMLHIILEDDGIGRKAAQQLQQPPSRNRKSLGMQITRERLSSYGQDHGHETRLDIEDLYQMDGSPQGTRVHIQLPI